MAAIFGDASHRREAWVSTSVAFYKATLNPGCGFGEQEREAER